jgi:hypothetical protein
MTLPILERIGRELSNVTLDRRVVDLLRECRAEILRLEAATRRWTHGRSGYVNHGCRCEKCKAAARLGQQRYHARRKADGICRSCTEPVDPGNVTYCARHRVIERERQARARLGRESERQVA